MKIEEKNFHIEIWHDVTPNINDLEFYVFKDGIKYFCWAFTLEGVRKIIAKNKLTGENANGVYFWATNSFILENITIDNIIAAITDIIEYNSNSLRIMFPE